MHTLNSVEFEHVAGGDGCTQVAQGLGAMVGASISLLGGGFAIVAGAGIGSALGDGMAGACNNPDAADGSAALDTVAPFMNGA